jgi:hypothetical protein
MRRRAVFATKAGTLYRHTLPVRQGSRRSLAALDLTAMPARTLPGSVGAVTAY